MNRPWFQSEERRALLEAAAKRWLGTPFFPRACSCGTGVDCVNLPSEIMREIGAIPRLKLPQYSLDHGHHNTRSQLLEYLLTTPELAGRLALVPPAGQRLPGDVLGLQSGFVDHHLAIQLKGELVLHAIPQGVVLHPAGDRRIVNRTLYVLRLMEANA